MTSTHHSDRYTALSLLDNAAMKRSSELRVDEAWQYHSTFPPDCLLGKQTEIVEESKTYPICCQGLLSPPVIGSLLNQEPSHVATCDVLQRTCTNSGSPHYKTIYIQNVTFISLHSVSPPPPPLNTLHFDTVTLFSSQFVDTTYIHCS